MVSRSPWLAKAGALGLLLACAPPRPAPFTREETDSALAPARDLWQRCYADTELARSGQVVTLDYGLNVAADGSVTSVPRQVNPERPELVECVRLRLNQLRFPARAKDHVGVHFELGPGGAGASTPRASSATALGTCEPPCDDGFACRYEPGAPRGVCRVATGRCRSRQDCAPLKVCQRHRVALGVCVDPRP